jgi:hypothetical protein
LRRNGREILRFGTVDSKIEIHFHKTLTENKRKSNVSAHFNASQPDSHQYRPNRAIHAKLSLSLQVNKPLSSFC